MPDDKVETGVAGEVREFHFRCDRGHEFSVFTKHEDVYVLIDCPVASCHSEACRRADNAAEVSADPSELTDEGGTDMSSMKERLTESGAGGIKQPETKAVHYLKGGETPCPMAREHGAPVTWPRGHVWSRRWEDVTCPECLAQKPAEAGGGGD